jgi:hypothetical protein
VAKDKRAEKKEKHRKRHKQSVTAENVVDEMSRGFAVEAVSNRLSFCDFVTVLSEILGLFRPKPSWSRIEE